LCPKRLLPYRGEDEDGNPNTDTNDPLKAGILVQTEAGVVKWSASPCNKPEEDVIKVANDSEAAIDTNYIPFVIGKAEDGCDRRLVGSPDEESGQWKMVWVADRQEWTTVPDPELEFTDLCTELVADLILDPDNVEGYLVQVLTTATMAVGVSLKISGYEMVVTEIVDSEYVRVESVFELAAPATIQEGTSVCNIGFRPCPRVEEPYADTIPGCLNDQVVSLEVPAAVNGMAIPGMLWRDQLGKWSFLPVPVDAVNGIVSSNYMLVTPASPQAAVANIPGFRSIPGFRMLSPVTIYTQHTAGMPVDDTKSVTLSGTAGFIVGAKAVLLTIAYHTITGTASFHVYVKVNGITRSHILTEPTDGDADVNQFIVEVPDDTILELEVDLDIGGGVIGTMQIFHLDIFVDGYYL
jgi:hypothetical protein